MPVPRQLLLHIRNNTKHLDFLDALLTDDVGNLAKKIYELLENQDMVINPGREKPCTFNALNPEALKELIVVQIALDLMHSTAYNQSIELQEDDEITQTIDENQARKGVIEHIKSEGTVIYHGVYHPIESAEVIAPFIDTLVEGKGLSPKKVQLLKQRARALFIQHDRVQHLDPANREKDGYALTKLPGFNEFETAALSYEERLAAHDIAYENEIGLAPDDTRIANLRTIRNELAYESWKNIVGGTTMLKAVDGQPTLNTLQILLGEAAYTPSDSEAPLVSPEQIEALKQNPLLMMSLAASAVDSLFPAMLPLIRAHSDMGSNLPFNLMEEGRIEIPLAIREMIFGDPTNSDAVNQTALFLGQNMRMFSEIHESFFVFKSALTQIQSFRGIHPDTLAKDVIEQDGVSLWNEAVHAARRGDRDTLKVLLERRIEHFKDNVQELPGGITRGMTLADVFINKLGGEISFAKGQGPELIAQAAAQLGLSKPCLDVCAWSNHAIALERLKKAYDDHPLFRVEIALALFQIAGNQPGLYVSSDILLADIQREQDALGARHEELTSEQLSLQHSINRLKIEIEALDCRPASAASTEPGDHSPASIMRVLLGGEDIIAGLSENKHAALLEAQQQLVRVQMTRDTLDQGSGNLARVRGDISSVRSHMPAADSAAARLAH